MADITFRITINFLSGLPKTNKNITLSMFPSPRNNFREKKKD